MKANCCKPFRCNLYETLRSRGSGLPVPCQCRAWSNVGLAPAVQEQTSLASGKMLAKVALGDRALRRASPRRLLGGSQLPRKQNCLGRQANIPTRHSNSTGTMLAFLWPAGEKTRIWRRRRSRSAKTARRLCCLPGHRTANAQTVANFAQICARDAKCPSRAGWTCHRKIPGGGACGRGARAQKELRARQSLT